MYSHLFQFGRIFMSAGLLVGGSFATIKLLENHITSLMVRSTITSLHEPEVHDDIYTLLKRLLKGLLDDPISKEKAAEFFKVVLHAEKLENTVLKLTKRAMESTEYKAEGLVLMRNLAQQLLNDRQLHEKTNDMSSTVARTAQVVEKAKEPVKVNNEENVNIKMKKDFKLMMPRIHFKKMMTSINDELDSETIKRFISKYSVQAAINYKGYSHPNFDVIRALPTERLEKSIKYITEEYKLIAPAAEPTVLTLTEPLVEQLTEPLVEKIAAPLSESPTESVSEFPTESLIEQLEDSSIKPLIIPQFEEGIEFIKQEVQFKLPVLIENPISLMINQFLEDTKNLGFDTPQQAKLEFPESEGLLVETKNLTFETIERLYIKY